MKVIELLGLIALAAVVVHSVPTDTEEEAAGQTPAMNSTADMATDVDEQTEPSEFFKREVKEYLDEQALLDLDPSRRATRQTTHAINHGDTIALQTYTRFNWLGCAGSKCKWASCPKMQMTGSDWTNCWGEVFRIYRAAGPGPVRAGDVVGIYYPRENGKWLGCAGSTCLKATCPGNPSTAHGFQTCDRWFKCWGEVFKIYAKRKGINAVINSDDDISLFYPNQQLWLAQGTGDADKRPCLGKVVPPPYDVYDGCAWETFRIWKKE